MESLPPPVSPPLPQDRKFIRFLSAFASCLILLPTLGLLVDWFYKSSSEKEPDLAFPIFSLFICGYLLFRIWKKPSAKTDRFILLGTLLIGSGLPFAVLTLLLPQSWITAVWTSALIILPAYLSHCYRALEKDCATKGEILPSVNTKPWPTDANWLAIQFFGIYLGWLIIFNSAGSFTSSPDMFLITMLLPAVILIPLYNFIVSKHLLHTTRSPVQELVNATKDTINVIPPQASNMMYELQKYLVCLLLGLIFYYLAFDYDWQTNPAHLAPFTVSAYFILLISALCYSIFRIWIKPTPKTQRLIMLISLMFMSILIYIAASEIVPTAWKYAFSWLFTFGFIPFYAKAYQFLAADWVKKDRIQPLANQPFWPIDTEWYVMAYAYLVLNWLFQHLLVTSYDGEDPVSNTFWQILLPGGLGYVTGKLHSRFFAPKLARQSLN